jgi:hypothetical protein
MPTDVDEAVNWGAGFVFLGLSCLVIICGLISVVAASLRKERLWVLQLVGVLVNGAPIYFFFHSH